MATLLVVVAGILNILIDTKISQLIAGDHDELEVPVSQGVLAIYTGGYQLSGGATECHELCRRILLNGIAEKVLLTQQEQPDAAIDAEARAVAYHMERGELCPALPLNKVDGFELLDDLQSEFSSIDVVQAEIAAGNCLMQSEARLATADTIISATRPSKIDRPRRYERDSAYGFIPCSPKVEASRLSVHQRQADGTFRETYRNTAIWSFQHFPLYLPFIGPYEPVCFGTTRRVGKNRDLSFVTRQRPDWNGFLTGRLGLDLTLRQDEAKARVRTVVATALAHEDGPTPEEMAVIDRLLRRADYGNRIEPEDAVLVRRVLTNRAMPLSRAAPGALRGLPADDIAAFREIAVATFQRLRDLAPKVVAGDQKAREQANRAAGLIANLPGEALEPHLDDLRWLARHPVLRVAAVEAFERLAVLGAEGAEELAFLVEDAARYREGDKRNDAWSYPLKAGMRGLCRMGPEVAAMLPRLREVLLRGEMALDVIGWRLPVNTFASLGMEADEIWQLVQANSDGIEREAFDWVMAQDKPNCS